MGGQGGPVGQRSPAGGRLHLEGAVRLVQARDSVQAGSIQRCRADLELTHGVPERIGRAHQDDFGPGRRSQVKARRNEQDGGHVGLRLRWNWSPLCVAAAGVQCRAAKSRTAIPSGSGCREAVERWRTRVLTGRGRLHDDARHVGGGRSPVRPRDHGIHGGGIACHQRFHAAVVAVAHPPGATQRQRFATQRVAGADPLYQPANLELPDHAHDVILPC